MISINQYKSVNWMLLNVIRVSISSSAHIDTPPMFPRQRSRAVSDILDIPQVCPVTGGTG